jgi:hypothetical protein
MDHPISGLPEFGTLSAQVGYIRLAMVRPAGDNYLLDRALEPLCSAQKLLRIHRFASHPRLVVQMRPR